MRSNSDHILLFIGLIVTMFLFANNILAKDEPLHSKQIVDNVIDEPQFIASADIDHDGVLDLAEAATDSNEIETIHGAALYPPEFIHTISDSVDGSVWSETADMDEDGDLDVIAAGYNEGSVSWFENIDGNALAWNRHIVSQRTDIDHWPYMVHSADIDRDGDLDLASIAIISSELSWYENVDGLAQSWITHTLAADVETARHLAIADLDRDGDKDLIATDTSDTHSLRWWENQNGAALWTEHLIFAVSRGMRPINIADVDGDGDFDVVSGTDSSREVYWFENLDGVGTIWANHLIDVDFSRPSYLDPVDLDRDGDIDILGTGWIQDEVVWWENDTNGANWTKHVIDGAFDYADTVRSFDVDRDGDLDVLGTSLGDDAVDEFAWWENVAGDASTWTKHLLAFADNATSIEAADLDQDGDLDILGAAFSDDTIIWWENRGGQFSLPTTDTAPEGINAGSQDDMLQIVATHNGRSGDNDLELTTFELLLEESPDDPLTNAEANAIIENLHVYLDDGSGVFEEGNDTWVTAVNTLELTDGIQTVQFVDDDPNVRVSWQALRTYYVVVELNLDLVDDPNRNDVSMLRLTHITEASSTAQDQLANIPLSLAYTPNVSAQIILLTPTAVSLQGIGAEETAVSFWLIAFVFGILILSSSYFYHRSKKRK